MNTVEYGYTASSDDPSRQLRVETIRFAGIGNVATIDPLTNRTDYAYSDSGELISVTNALGDATVYEYDLRGNKVYEGGATYPVRYAYDVYGNKVSMTTYRDFAAAHTNWGCGILSAPEFSWTYEANSDLKSSLTYPNGLIASWTYNNRGELLEVNNTSSIGTISRYAYTYDAAGRRIACAHSGSAFDTSDANTYLYNLRSELTNATAAVDSNYHYGYDFDDIGNRNAATERGTNSVYTAKAVDCE